MGKWLSSLVKEKPEVREALSDLADEIREYEDAAKPSACREMGGSFWSSELTFFRPEWKRFATISLVCGVAGIIFSLLVPSYEKAGDWADLALKITIPVFVLGLSLVTVARSIGESMKFAGEYLNDSCRMPWFCCLTMIAVLCGLVGYFLSSIAVFPNFVVVGICMASVGAAIVCLAMLAFVIFETINCSLPSKSIGIVSRYAARKLTWAYLKEAYGILFWSQQKDCLEKWCDGKSIHPPSQYYGHYYKSSLQLGNGDNNVEIKLDGLILQQNAYIDYNLKNLKKLDKYLKNNGAELYLSSLLFESERKILGILNCENVKQKERLLSVVRKKCRKTISWKQYKFSETGEDFWDSQESKLNEAIKRAIGRQADPILLKAYLDAVNVPLSVLRQVRKKHKVVRDAYGEYVSRGYQFLRLYLKALREIFLMKEKDQAYKLARTVLISVWEETKNILSDMDYHSMELYTWLVQQMYTLINGAEDEAKNLQEMRGQFGGFYEFASGWMNEGQSKNAEDINKMRLVLHDGLTKWLLAAIEKKDGELIEQLCDEARKIVFGRDVIKFDDKEVIVHHFVLAGHLIALAKSKGIDATSIERLFFERYSHEAKVNFDKLIRFYLDNTIDFKELDKYRQIFYLPTENRINLLTGSLSSSGSGMTGFREMAFAFVFLAAHAIINCDKTPEPIAGISGRITDNDIDTVSKVFQNHMIMYDFKQLKEWLKSCKDFDETKEDREIAEAEIDDEKRQEHERKFWEAYSRATPVLSMCLRNGNYEIDNNIKNEWHYTVPKIALYNYKYPISGAGGDDCGLSTGHKMERNLLRTIIEGSNDGSEVEGDLLKAIGKAVEWLEKEKCTSDKGIVIVAGGRLPEIEMHGDKDFVPSWREDVKSKGFNGFYRGFPILWLREENEEEGEEIEPKDKKPPSQMVVAVDFRKWIGLRIRNVVIAEPPKFGELKIRTWSPDEIKRAIESGKLEEKDVDKAKGNCPVDVTFFWESIKGELPRIRSFKF